MDIRPLAQLSADDLRGLITGYISPARYRVHKAETDEKTTFTLELVPLAVPYVKRYEPPDKETLQHYLEMPRLGVSLGAYEGETLIGITLAEVQAWSNRLWVWEFHIAEAYRGIGVGTQLMDMLAQRSRQTGLRAIFCETQTTNVPAIRFYRRVGFTLEGLNLAFYSNDDYPDGEIALFMKRNLQD